MKRYLTYVAVAVMYLWVAATWVAFGLVVFTDIGRDDPSPPACVEPCYTTPP